jgi:hypothetical protein
MSIEKKIEIKFGESDGVIPVILFTIPSTNNNFFVDFVYEDTEEDNKEK